MSFKVHFRIYCSVSAPYIYVCWFAIVCYYVLLLMFAGLLFVRVWRMACRCQRVRNGLLCLHIEPSSHPKATTEVADMEVLPPVCIQTSFSVTFTRNVENPEYAWYVSRTHEWQALPPRNLAAIRNPLCCTCLSVYRQSH